MMMLGSWLRKAQHIYTMECYPSNVNQAIEEYLLNMDIFNTSSVNSVDICRYTNSYHVCWKILEI